ncbi:MAG: hypothetical protein E7157_05395 [Lactobacillales bacterium]|nr:hypothetical protein [Lactobacillales bacterium]
MVAWTEKQIQVLMENINIVPISKLQLLLNKDYYQILDKLDELGIEYISTRWTEEEEQLLISLADKCYLKELSKILNRTEDAILTKACKMGIDYIKLIREFKEEEIKYIKENYGKIAVTDMARELKVGRGAIENQIKKLNLPKLGNNPYKFWTDKKIQKLKDLSKTKTITELAQIFHTTNSAISTIAYENKITLIDEKIKWTEKDNEQLKELAKTKTLEEMAIIMNRSTSAIRLQAKRQNIKILSNRNLWTKEDDETLKKLVNEDKDLFEIIEIMSKTDSNVLKKARELQLKVKYENRKLTEGEELKLIEDVKLVNINELVILYKLTSARIKQIAKKHNVEVMSSKKNWTKAELETLKKLVEEGKTPKEIAKIFNRSEDAVTIKINRSGLKITTNDKMFWTEEEENTLCDLWGNVSIETIAKNLNRTESSILNKVYQLGLGSSMDNNYELLKVQDICDMFNVLPAQVNITWVALGLNLRSKRITKSKSYLCVTLDDLLDFLEKNQNIWDSRNLEENLLGIEPEWLKEKRKRDVETSFVPEKVNLLKQQLILDEKYYVDDEKCKVKKK